MAERAASKLWGLKSLEGIVAAPEAEFSSRYMALRGLLDYIKATPSSISQGTINALCALLMDQGPAQRMRRSWFLYREGAKALSFIATSPGASPFLKKSAFVGLKALLERTSGVPKKAVAEALGSLPLPIRGPGVGVVADAFMDELPEIDLATILEEAADERGGGGHIFETEWRGRSLVLWGESREPLVVKLAFGPQEVEGLRTEVQWLRYFEERAEWSREFHFPRPIYIKGSYLFRPFGATFKGLFQQMNGTRPPVAAISFRAPVHYFSYINEPLKVDGLGLETFKEALSKNAWLMARLASVGIIHTAPIPLFHNRVQRERRDDMGLYQWWRGGRLDRWLDSCRYPNMALSGLRDLEHLLSYNGPPVELYRHMGAQVLSLFLLAGSYFRNLAPQRRGRGPDGRPVDARDLFSFEGLRGVLNAAIRSYVSGFSAKEVEPSPPFDMDRLVRRMIDEMGVDRHMEEVLRRLDQDRMSDEEFRRFLLDRGVTEAQLAATEKGAKDITILTGPHLGGFNQRISIPELLEAAGSVAALSIATRWEALLN